MAAINGDRRAGEERSLQMLAQTALGGGKGRLEPGYALDVKTHVGEFVTDEFVAKPAEGGLAGGLAQARIVFLRDELGDQEHPAGPGEIAKGAEAAKHHVGEDGAARRDRGSVHEAKQEGGVLGLLAHEEHRGFVKRGVAMSQRKERGEAEIPVRLGRAAALKLGDGGGDASALVFTKRRRVVPRNPPVPGAARAKVDGPLCARARGGMFGKLGGRRRGRGAMPGGCGLGGESIRRGGRGGRSGDEDGVHCPSMAVPHEDRMKQA